MIKLANEYFIFGGHWILFLNDLMPNRFEKVFDYLLQSKFYKKYFNKFTFKKQLCVFLANIIKSHRFFFI